MTICHGIPWYRNGADDHCPFIIEGWWLFFYPLSYLTLTFQGRVEGLGQEKADAFTGRLPFWGLLTSWNFIYFP